MNTHRHKPLRIGLTGGIASGKSTVADMFADLGVPVIDTDVIAREVVEPGQPALAEVRETFGDGVIAARGRGGLTIIHAPRGGTIEVRLPAGITDRATATWIDPRNGERRQAMASESSRRRYDAPSALDWVLELAPDAEGPR